MTDSSFDPTKSNPLTSQIQEIDLMYDNGETQTTIPRLNLFNNVHCKFEKLEMIESVFEQYPKGAITVRDISDVITVIKEQKYNVIYIKYLDNSIHYFYITSTSYINNPASENSETYVSIHFSNHLYHVAEQESLVNIINTKKPTVSLIHEFFIDNITKFRNALSEHFRYVNQIDFTNIDQTENFVLYKPLNCLESKTDLPTDNFIQYLSYLSSYAVKSNPGVVKLLPRFMFWTGWDNTMNFKYFYQNCSQDTAQITKLNQNNFRYAVYNSDSPSIKITTPSGDKPFKKIYAFLTSPADQFMSTKAFYVRKTPRILNPGSTTPYDQLLYQYQDEGEKYSIAIVTSDGILNNVPKGANEITYDSHWGYYDDLMSPNLVNKSTHIGTVLGLQQKYVNTNFMGLNGLFPYIDSVEMWKHQFDLTPLHPNCPSTLYTKNNTNLDKIISIRYDIYQRTGGISKQLEKIRQVERQNFVSYVLCCLSTPEEDLKDETFFAAITGYVPEVSPYAQTGVNGEPLKYLYYFIRLRPTIPISIGVPTSPTQNNQFRAMEITTSNLNSPWGFDLNSKDRSIFGDYSTYAINLNERTSEYYPSLQDGRYAPGWHAKSILQREYTNVTYRPISHDIGDLKTSDGCTSFDCGKRHIVRMTKTPIKRLLLESGITDTDVLEYYKDRYLYTFAAENVVDGRCPTPTP